VREIVLKRKGKVGTTSNNQSVTSSNVSSSSRRTGMKSKGAATLWCYFLGGLGAHKFYLGQPIVGILYFLFVWTLIPPILSFIDFIILVLMTDDDFNRQF